ncbi:hypothetical protein FH972_017213 [Carpinus fangiana]|uniref:HMG box domain-containing protein n=1 Tax=Carpinus fangiana TaxID=176857 RepID=A0A5N6RKB9_9ROSI|nr:hypothetical protein FH972_017213 [Carpinus fangiana]
MSYVFNLPDETVICVSAWCIGFIVGTLAWLLELSFCFFSLSTINVAIVTMKGPKGKGTARNTRENLKPVDDRKIGKRKAVAKADKSSKRQPKKQRDAKKDPNKPKRPPSAFFVFLEEFRKDFKKEHPDIKAVSADSARDDGEEESDRSKSEVHDDDVVASAESFVLNSPELPKEVNYVVEEKLASCSEMVKFKMSVALKDNRDYDGKSSFNSSGNSWDNPSKHMKYINLVLYLKCIYGT